MSKSEDTQKSDKAPKVIREDIFFRPYVLPSYSIRYMDDGTTIYSESESLYSNDKVKVIGHDAGYFHKYFAGFGFE